MWQDSGRELADLAAMHAFCIGVLERALGHPVPVPTGLSPTSQPANLSPEQRVALTLNIQRRWMSLLNVAISAEMYRNALTDNTAARTVEALLRYYAWKERHLPADRDKADLLVTFLLKRQKPDMRDAESARHARREFEAKLVQMLGDPELPDHHAQLAREFEFLRVEVDEIEDFDKLVDSGLIVRVREIKESFGESFYHPRVLAAVAVHNVAFGERFGSLFRGAAQKIQAFANKVQSEGGSQDDSELVARLAKVNEHLILSDEYQRAQAHFHQVSHYKKVVDTRTAARKPLPPPPPVPAAAAPKSAEAKSGSAAVLEAQRGMLAQLEDGKLKTVEDSIRSFVKTMGQRPTCLVPLRNVNLSMITPEIESFRSEFGTERSFRADYAATHRRVLSILGRVMSEAKDFEAKQNSEFLWKPHADSLAFLLEAGRIAADDASRLAGLAEQRGLADKAGAMKMTLQRLQAEMQRVAQIIENTTAKAALK
jgi:hypothetical protein